MLSCDEAIRCIARSADLDERPPELEEHLDACSSCRAALDDQRVVARVLHARPLDIVSPFFVVRLNDRLDEVIGWFGIADWRAWTFRLTPAAAVLALVAYLTSDAATAAPSLAEWTMSGPEAYSNAAVLWEADVSPDRVVETMLVDPGDAGTGESGDAR